MKTHVLQWAIIHNHDYLLFHTPMSMNVSTINIRTSLGITSSHASMSLTHRTVRDETQKLLMLQLLALGHSVSRLKFRSTFLCNIANLLLRLMTQNKNIKGHSKSREQL